MERVSKSLRGAYQSRPDPNSARGKRFHPGARPQLLVQYSPYCPDKYRGYWHAYLPLCIAQLAVASTEPLNVIQKPNFYFVDGALGMLTYQRRSVCSISKIPTHLQGTRGSSLSLFSYPK